MVVSMIGLDMLAFLFGNLGVERYTPLRGDESCAQMLETKRVKCVSVAHVSAEVIERSEVRGTLEVRRIVIEAMAVLFHHPPGTPRSAPRPKHSIRQNYDFVKSSRSD
jgi:hypothetical protein